jgi:predicted enzyme related to lactoylglutathione lyase
MDESMKKHGVFSWTELITHDVEGSKKFYSKLLGWTMEDMSMGEAGSYTMLKSGDRMVGGLMAMPPQAKDTPTYWGAYVTVDDVDAVAKQAGELGAKILVPPMDIPEVGRFCTFQDPQGAVLSVIAYSE